MTDDKPKEMNLLEHLGELRIRLFKIIISVLLAFLLSYGFSEPLFQILLIPFKGAYRAVLGSNPSLIFTSPFEPFFAYIKISLAAGLFIASPFILYQVWAFISPGLYKKERKLAAPFVILGVLSLIGGVLFAYFLVFPVIFRFFIGYSSEFIQPAIKVSDYLKVSLSILLIFGFIFEIPLIILFLVKLRILSHEILLKKWKYVIISIAVLSAVLTPADPISMLLTMIPLYFFYMITVFLAYLIRNKS
jgi:sec-independent protein translocase protein TatC